MFTMDQIHRIRNLYYEQGITDMAEIGRTVNCDWRTVRKYIDKEDFSPQKPVATSQIANTQGRMLMYFSELHRNGSCIKRVKSISEDTFPGWASELRGSTERTRS